MNSSKSIRKIKVDHRKVEVHYVEHLFTDDERVLNVSHQIKSQVKPHEDFVAEFQDLKLHAIPIMELSPFKNSVEEKQSEKHIVTTLNVFESDDDTVVMISMNKYLENGKCYSVTSPRIELGSYDYEKIDKLSELVDRIIGQAMDFVNGKKHGEEQLTLEFDAA